MGAETRQQPTVPTLTAEGREALLHFLSGLYEAAKKGESGCLKGSKFDPTGMQLKNAQYWRNVASGIKWAAGKLRKAKVAGAAVRPSAS
jgi:hypothetical protein